MENGFNLEDIECYFSFQKTQDWYGWKYWWMRKLYACDDAEEIIFVNIGCK